MEEEIKVNRKTIIYAVLVVAFLLLIGYFTTTIASLRTQIDELKGRTETNSQHIAEIVDFIKKATQPQQ